MTSLRARPRAFVLAVAGLTAALAACSSTTSGSGSGQASPPRGSSTADFPTGVASASETLAPSTPGAPSTSGSGAAAHPAPAAPLRTATVHATDGVTYVIKVWADVKDTSCFDHAYGQPMITFLTQHPCRGLDRLLATTAVHGRPVGFAETITSFNGTPTDPYADSRKFRQLEMADGTGSINDLLREGYRLPSGPTSVPSSEAFNVVGQDNGVTVWDVWYLTGSTPNNDKALITMTMDTFLQF